LLKALERQEQWPLSIMYSRIMVEWCTTLVFKLG